MSNFAVLKLINKQQINLEISKKRLNFISPHLIWTTKIIGNSVVAMVVVVLVLSSGDIFGGQGSAKSWPVLDTK